MTRRDQAELVFEKISSAIINLKIIRLSFFFKKKHNSLFDCMKEHIPNVFVRVDKPGLKASNREESLW